MTGSSPRVHAFGMVAGELWVGGSFQAAGGLAVGGLARWNGSAWSAPTGCDGQINVLTALADGSVVAGGSFTTIGGVAATNIARWDGMAWNPLGPGITQNGVPAGAVVLAVVALPKGSLAVGGSFTFTAGGVPLAGITVWNGTRWSSIGGPGNAIYGVILRSNGELIVGGTFGAVRGPSPCRS